MKESLYISFVGKGGMLRGYLLQNPYPYEFLSSMTKVPGVLNLLGSGWDEAMNIFASDLENQLGRDKFVFLDYARDVLYSYLAERVFADLRQVDLIGYGFVKDTSVEDAIYYVQELADRYVTYLFEIKFNDNYSWVQKSKNNIRSPDNLAYVTPVYLSGMLLDKFVNWFRAFQTYPANMIAELTLGLMKEKGPGAEITKTEISDLVVHDIERPATRVDALMKISEMFDVCTSIKNQRIGKDDNRHYWNILVGNISDQKSLDTFLMANSSPNGRGLSPEFQQSVKDEVARIGAKVEVSASFSIEALRQETAQKVIKEAYVPVREMAVEYIGQCFVNALHGYDTSLYAACPSECVQPAHRRNSGPKDSIGILV